MATSEGPSGSRPITTNSYDTALCLIPPRSVCGPVDRLRGLYDKTYEIWPPHINLIYPFVSPDDLERVLPVVHSALEAWRREAPEESLPIRLDSAGVFRHKRDSTIYLRDTDTQHTEHLKELRRFILGALGQRDGECQPHLTVGQSQDAEDSWHHFLVQKANLLPALAWQADEIYLLVRERGQVGGVTSSRMRPWATLPLLSAAQPVHSERPARPAQVARAAGDDAGTRGTTYGFSNGTGRWEPCVGTPRGPQETPKQLSVASYNVLAEFQYPPSQARYPLLVKNILSEQAVADVLVLQEVTDDFLSFLLADERLQMAYPFSSHGPPYQPDMEPLPSHNNIVVLSRWPFDWELVPFQREHKGSLVAGFGSIGERDDAGFTPLVLAAVHLTCGLKDGAVAARKGEIQRVLKHLDSRYPGHPAVLAGDFNITTSSCTIRAALERKAISPQTAGHLSGFAKAFADAGFLDGWMISHLERGDPPGEDGGEAFEGEQGATYDPTANTLAAEIVGSGSNMRPQRYDRILVRGEGFLRIAAFNKFGLDAGELESSPEDARTSYASDHWGVRCVLRVGAEPAEGRSGLSEQVVPVHLKAAPAPLSDIGAVRDCLATLQVFPTEEEAQGRSEALTLLRNVILDEAPDAPDAAGHGRARQALVVVPVGSYGLGVWTASSDIDCLCIGSFSTKTFFTLVAQRLRKASDRGIRILRRVRAHTGTMLELDVQGIKVDLQYCPATAVAENWPEALKLPASHPIWTLSAQTLSKLKAARDLHYIRGSIPDVANFRLAHRLVKTWARSRGIYGSRFGYLGGIQISILLARVCKSLARGAGASPSVADTLTTFFSHYAGFDWKDKAAFDPFFHKQRLPYVRTAREPLAILGYHTPSLNTSQAASVPSVRTIAEEFARAERLLGQDGATWTVFLGDAGGAPSASGGVLGGGGAEDFLGAYKRYVKIDIQYWGLSLAKGSALIGWLESRCVMLLVDIHRRLPALHARIWPARFVWVADADADAAADEDDASGPRNYQGCYLIGLDRPADAAMTRDEARAALGALQVVLRRFEEQIRGEERYFHPSSSWMSAEVVSRGGLGGLALDGRDWGEHTIGDDEEDEDEEEDVGDAPGPDGVEQYERHLAAKKERRREKKGRAPAGAGGGAAPKPEGAGRLRTAADALSRLRWDAGLDSGDYVVGYEDRFLGARERPLEAWKSELTDEEFIPQHRILYFRRRSDGVKVWERRTRKDDLFGSGV